MTTGVMPYRSQRASVTAVPCSYTTAIARTMSVAGRMKSEAGDEQAGPPPALVSDPHRDLGGRRARQQARQPDEVDEALARQPLAPLDELALHDREVGRRPAERRQPQPRERPGQLGEARAHRSVDREVVGALVAARCAPCAAA